MKRIQIIIAILVLALAGFAGWRILKGKPAAAKSGEHAEEGGHGEHEEHGKEGHVELTAEQRKNANITVEEAGPAKIKTSLSVYGKVGANEEAIAHVMPRFQGVVKAVRKRLGDRVDRGEGARAGREQRKPQGLRRGLRNSGDRDSQGHHAG